MLFNSLHFVGFFAVVFGVSFALRARVRARNAFLLLASYYFYGSWDWRFLGLILISTIVDYACGLGMGERTEPRGARRRWLLILSLVTNLGILGFFKYYDFFVESAVEALGALGVRAHVETLRIVLPVGISFYTFQTLSYTIDRYRGLLRAERSLLDFALFVAFFPQLVAGPIERARHLLPQIRRPSSLSWWHLHSGFQLMAWGMFKKVVLADNAARVADAVFGAFGGGPPTEASGGSVLLGTFAFAIQIYCDFSGYTDVARGAARCMGFDLMLNFRQPYFALNPRDFWRRWHISLSSWLRDYLYVPLGGNRKGPRRTYLHLMLTMLLGGLWHGAAWNFVLWGLYCGALLALHRVLAPVLARFAAPRSPMGQRGWFLVRVLVMFSLTCAGWLLFRVESLAQLGAMSGEILTSLRYNSAILGPQGLVTLVGCTAVLLPIEIAQYRGGDSWMLKLPLAPRCLLYLLLMLGFIIFGRYDGAPFLYFQF